MWLNPSPLRIHLCIRPLVSLASQSSVLIGSTPVLFIQTRILAKTCSGFYGKQLSSIFLLKFWLFGDWNSVLESSVSNLLVEVSLTIENDSDTSIIIMAKGKVHMQIQAKEVEVYVEE